MRLLLTIIFLGVFANCFAQSPNILWQQTMGGYGEDKAACIRETKDGGYIVAGYSISFNNGNVTGNHGNADFWVVKLNTSGSIQWQKSYGGSGDDEATSISLTNDGGYIVAGFSSSSDGDVTVNHGRWDYWIVKIDSSGTLQWQKSLGGSLDDFAYSVKQTADSGYVVVGSSTSKDGDVAGNHGSGDYWVVKLTPSGSVQWKKAYGGSGSDDGFDISPTADGGFIVAGTSFSHDSDITSAHGLYDTWVLKLNGSGAIQWQKTYGGSNMDDARSVQQTADGGYILAGTTESVDGDVTGNHGGADYWVVKISQAGAIEWQKTYGGPSTDLAYSIQQTSDSGYIMIGYSASTGGDITGFRGGVADYWVVKTNSSGAMQWQKTLGGSYTDEGAFIRQNRDGSYVMAGFTSSNDGDVSGYIGTGDYWIVKLNDHVGIDYIGKGEGISVYPNPANNMITLKASPMLIGEEYMLSDVAGIVLLRGRIRSELTTENMEHLQPGTYFLQVGRYGTQSYKIVKQ